MAPTEEADEWVAHVDEVTAQIKGIIDGSITDFEDFDKKLALKERAKQIREEERKERRERFFLDGREGKGVGTNYKWWCRRCFVEYRIDLTENKCTRCKQSDMMLAQEQRREELMGKLEMFRQEKAKHQFRKDKWLRWKKSQAMLKRSRYINYKAWEYWEPDTDTEDEGDPIVPRDNPEFLAMETDMLQRKKKNVERTRTARKCRERGNEHMKDGDMLAAIECYEEGLEYRRDDKALWTNKALAELKVFRYHEAIASCNKVIEYSEIFEDGFTRSADACFKAFTRRAIALRGLHRWEEAVADLEDAVKLFPKDREARDLLHKSKAACAEASAVQSQHDQLQASTVPVSVNEIDDPADGASHAAAALPPSAMMPPASAPASAQVRADGSVRVAIEEESDEEDACAEDALILQGRDSGFLASLTGKEFTTLVKLLREDPQERSRFCARGARTAIDDSKKRRDDGRRLDIRVEEVVEPSKLDCVMRDAERCCILFKKRQGHVTPLRSDVVHVGATAGDNTEDRENSVFLRVAPPRVLQVLHVLASNSDHHCELSAMSARHVLPLLASECWRYALLELLLEWSQRSVSAKVMAEFLGRYPTPHLALLIEAVTHESKENVLPPGFESRAQAASDALEAGRLGIDSALDEVLQGLTEPSLAELAVSTLANVCVAGQRVPIFKEQLTPFCDALVGAFKRRLRAADWRLCGRTAGAVCNVVRLGDCFAVAVHERCLEALVSSLRDEQKGSGPGSDSFLRDLQAHGSRLGASKATGRLSGALANLLAVRPASAEAMLNLGTLDICAELFDPEAASVTPTPLDDAKPVEVAVRAAQVCNGLLASSPGALSTARESDLLRRAYRVLELYSSEGGGREFASARTAAAAGDAGGGGPTQALLMLDLSVRLLTTILVKTPGALFRLASITAPAGVHVEELTDHDLNAAAAPPLPWDLRDLLRILSSLFKAFQPSAYLGADEEGKTPSRIRGNLALFFSALAEAQARDDAPLSLNQLDLTPLLAPLVDTLRKERGKVQHNIGVCVTRLAQSQRYRNTVRDLNGIETLHQVQLPRVEAQKERAMKLHRLRGPETAPAAVEVTPLASNSAAEKTLAATSSAALVAASVARAVPAPSNSATFATLATAATPQLGKTGGERAAAAANSAAPTEDLPFGLD